MFWGGGFMVKDIGVGIDLVSFYTETFGICVVYFVLANIDKSLP